MRCHSMSDVSPDLPPCIWCGNSNTKEVTTTKAPKRQRWFECGYCHRAFCVFFVPADPEGSGNGNAGVN